MFDKNFKKKLTCIFDRQDIFPWPWTFADEILTKEIGEITNGKICSLIIEEFKNGHIHHYVDGIEIDLIGEALVEKILKDKSFYKGILKKVYRLSKELNSFSHKVIKDDYTLCSDTALTALIGKYVLLLKELRLWGWVPPLIDGLASPFLSNVCIQSIRDDFSSLSEKEIKRIYSTLTSPVAFGQAQQSEIDKYNLVKKIGRNVFEKFRHRGDTKTALDIIPKSIQKSVKDYIAKYAWITYNYEGPGLTLNAFYKDVSTLSYAESLKQLSRIQDNSEELKKEKVKLLKKFKISPKTRYLLKVATAFLLLKEYRKSVYQYSYVATDKPLGEIAGRIGTTLKSIKFLSIAEIKEALKNKNVKKFLSRQSYSVVVVEHGGSEFYDKAQGAKIVEFYVRKNKLDIKESFEGQVAYPGEVKGLAKIVMTTKDLSKMNTGDILLSSSTNPDLLPAMKKAGAIVTDMGGIICHAAIVSRELKIPCVVGTHDITKYVKDGDLLMVDANNGTIIRLKNKS